MRTRWRGNRRGPQARPPKRRQRRSSQTRAGVATTGSSTTEPDVWNSSVGASGSGGACRHRITVPDGEGHTCYFCGGVV